MQKKYVVRLTDAEREMLESACQGSGVSRRRRFVVPEFS